MSWFSCSPSLSRTPDSQRTERNIQDAYVYLSPLHFHVFSLPVSSPSQHNQNHGRGRSARTLRTSWRRRPCACSMDHQSLRSKAWRRLGTVRHLSPSSFSFWDYTIVSCRRVAFLPMVNLNLSIIPAMEKLFCIFASLVTTTHPAGKNSDLRKFRWLQPVLQRTRIPLGWRWRPAQLGASGLFLYGLGDFG